MPTTEQLTNETVEKDLDLLKDLIEEDLEVSNNSSRLADLVNTLMQDYEPDEYLLRYPDRGGIYYFGDKEYLIIQQQEANSIAGEVILDTVWAFNADFLCYYLCEGKLTAHQINLLRGDSCEDINDAFLVMLGDKKKEFIRDAIWSDGRGHFISNYDGVEHEVGDYYLYRLN
jgi:Ni/Co efflux regulator RcnB